MFINLLKYFSIIAITMSQTLFGATGDPALINEVLASHSGSDDTEFIELFGTPETNLSGKSLIVVEGDAFAAGSIDRRFDFKSFHSFGENGFFLFGNCAGLDANYSVTPDAQFGNNYLENSSQTIALVLTDSLSDSIPLMVTGDEVVLDAVALNDGGAGDIFFFGAPVIGPDGPFFPAGARRIIDGVDTGSADDWTFASFFLPGDNTPTGGGRDGCAEDEDNDGVPDDADLCPGTVYPESVPLKHLGVNRWALTENDVVFSTDNKKGKLKDVEISTLDTGGCSCEQIIENLDLGKGHQEFGCSTSALRDWIELID